MNAEPKTTEPRIGVGMHSYGPSWAAGRSNNPLAHFHDARTFLEYCHSLGAAGVQVAIGIKEKPYTDGLRAFAESKGLYLEAQGSLPLDASDLQRFEKELITARESGASIYRTAMLGGRRYEQLGSLDEFTRFARRAFDRIQLAIPLLKKHDVRLAIENHKDYLAPELRELLVRLGSEHVGVTLDTGNSIALLEDPTEVIETLAPVTISVHLKDMGVADHPEGFLLSEVPLGEGYLDLKRIVEVIHKTAPAATFSIEMLTRDPLKIPCLTDKYWSTMPVVPAAVLAKALASLKAKRSIKPLPLVKGLSLPQQLELEDQNVRSCLAYARINLNS